MTEVKMCILDSSKRCDSCGECDRCDLNPSVKCTNCGACIAGSDFRAIEITDILFQQEGPDSDLERRLGEGGLPAARNRVSAHSDSTTSRKPWHIVRKGKR